MREATPPVHLSRVFRVAEQLRPWSMIEVFVFGVFVAYVKLGVVEIGLLPASMRSWHLPSSLSGSIRRSIVRRSGRGSTTVT